MMNATSTKPLGRKCYGSIGHLPNSRLGPGDHKVSPGQARICTECVRDKHDTVYVEMKLDGSCVGVALLDGKLIPLNRAGWPCVSSPHEQHRLFDTYVWQNEQQFRTVLREGERIVGEWLALAHGTLYDLEYYPPFCVFDIMAGEQRMLRQAFWARLYQSGLWAAPLLHDGGALSTKDAMSKLDGRLEFPCDQHEGVVYRVERQGRVDFLAKHVRGDKVDGKHLPEISGKPAVWHWRPDRS